MIMKLLVIIEENASEKQLLLCRRYWQARGLDCYLAMIGACIHTCTGKELSRDGREQCEHPEDATAGTPLCSACTE
jgi:hypothetical protein